MALEILQKKVRSDAMALFRGNLPPRIEELNLESFGLKLRKREPSEQFHWRVELEHPEWGKALLVAPRRDLKPPRFIYEVDARLSPENKELSDQVGCSLHLVVDGRKSFILHDRKCMLRYLAAVMGDDGLLAFDRLSNRFWTREDLNHELSHDADLDVDALIVVHSVGADGNPRWVHTHGLGEIGAWDFDILGGHDDIGSVNGYELMRAIAFAILEGKAGPGTNFQIASPGGEIQFVDVQQFHRKAQAKWTKLREMDDDSHSKNRLILCEPARGLFRRWRNQSEPSKFLASGIHDGMIFTFSSAATDLMAERARKTYPMFRQFFDEFADLELPTIVKIGYETDHGDSEGREHLWFRVHSHEDNGMDATLENDPYDIRRLRKGMRGFHRVDDLTDWMIFSPVGTINPRDFGPISELRKHKDEILRASQYDQETD